MTNRFAVPPRLENPFILRPEAHTQIDRTATQLIAALTDSRLLAIRISSNEFFRIEKLGFGGDTGGLVDFSQLVFSLRINDVRHRSFGNLSDQIGSIDDLTQVDVRIREEGALVELFCENTDAVDGATVSVRWVGWTFPLREGERF